MWLYLFGAVAAIAVLASIFFWRLYEDAIHRDIATSEVLCAVLLDPVLHIEFQDIAYAKINASFPPEMDPPSEIEIALLQQQLMATLGSSAFLYSSGMGPGATLRRILTGPFIVGRRTDELWRFNKP